MCIVSSRVYQKAIGCVSRGTKQQNNKTTKTIKIINPMKKLYAIYDVKSETHTPPFVASNEHDAARQMASALMSSPTIPPAIYPEDFYLVQLGRWDEISGVIHPEIIRHCSCEFILRSFAKKSASAEESKKEENDNA